MRHFRMTTLGLAILLLCKSALADEAGARRRLAAAGLVEAKAGRLWVAREALQLRRRVDSLGRLERTYFPAQRKFQELVGQYERYRNQLEKLRDLLAENIARLGGNSLGTSQRQQLEGENQQLGEQIIKLEEKVTEELNALDERSDLTNSAVAFSNARNELVLALLAIKQGAAKSRQRFAELRKDDAVQAALEELGPEHKLSPPETIDAALDRRLKRLAESAMSDGAPVYRRGGEYRLSVIIAESTPATFTYTGPQGPTIVTSSMLQAAGVRVPRGGKQEIVRDGDREVAVRRATLPSLRAGKYTVRDVPVFVLPPEAEDFGARISSQAFGNHLGLLETKRLWFRVVQRGEQ